MDVSKQLRDASVRLFFWISMPSIDQFPALALEIASTFGLHADGNFVTDGATVIFWNFHRANQAVELAWDNWMEFTVTAISPDAEPLAQQIVTFLVAKLAQ